MLRGERQGLPERPMSVEEVVKMADEQVFDPQYNIQHYFRTASLMVKQANIYEHEGNDQMAYFLLYRHARLILDDLPDHPSAKDVQHRKPWAEARKEVNTSLAKLELLKPRINKRFQRFVDRRRAIAAESIHLDPDRDLKRHPASLGEDDGEFERLDPTKNQDMAVDQANREIQRRIGKLRKKAVTQHHISSIGSEGEAYMTRARKQLQQFESSTSGVKAAGSHTHSRMDYNYPTVDVGREQSRRQGMTTDYRAGDHDQPSFSSATTQQQYHALTPSLPPKEPLASPHGAYQTAPQYSHAPKVPSKAPLLPSPPPSPKPTHQFMSSAHLENGQSLRTIFLPAPLRHHFLSIAEPNTAAHLETCGILCGTLIRNAFFITKLVIPEQTSTTDTCEMINEAALYGYIDAQPEELMVLGWIHTHPTQTCFMSSRDLHTHVWYQVQLSESIAIVCSPSKTPGWGVFRLTDPPGVGSIKTCSKPGIFHPHDQTQLFTDVLGRPGHVIEHEDLHFEMIDLRP